MSPELLFKGSTRQARDAQGLPVGDPTLGIEVHGELREAILLRQASSLEDFVGNIQCHIHILAALSASVKENRNATPRVAGSGRGFDTTMLHRFLESERLSPVRAVV